MKRILFIILLINSYVFCQDVTFINKKVNLYNIDITDKVYNLGSTINDSLQFYISARKTLVDSLVVSDTNNITLNDTSFTVTFGDTIVIPFVLKSDSVASYTDTIIAYYASRTLEIVINWEVVTEIYNLFAETTVDFDTVNELTFDTLITWNPNLTYIISNITYDGLATPFSVSNTVTSMAPNTVYDLLITFNPVLLGAGTYTDTLFIYSSVDDTAQVILTGTYVGVPVAASEWVMSSMGGGGWYQDYEINPVDEQKLYVVSDLGGFGFSTDGGLTWTTSNSDTGSYELNDLDITSDGTEIYLGGGAGIFKSTDNGLNWTRLGTGQIYSAQSHSYDAIGGDAVSIGAVFVHPANDDIIYAGTGFKHDVNSNVGNDDTSTPIYEPNNNQSAFPHPCKVYKSTNGGVTWTTVTGTIEPNINAVGGFAGHPTDANIVYVGTKQGVYKTTNGGSSWTRLSYDRAEKIVVNPANPNQVWYTKYTDDLYYSTNGGTSFTNIGGNVPLTSGSKIGDIEITSDGSKLVLGTNNTMGFYTSTNSGTTWTKVTGTAEAGYSGDIGIATQIGINSDASVIMGGYGTIYISYNSGVDWFDGASKEVRNDYWITRGTSVEVVYDIAVNPINSQTVIQAHSDHGGAISLDGGLSYKNYNSSTFSGGYNEGTAIGWHPDSTTVYMALALDIHNYRSRIYKSTNGGHTWTQTGFSANASIWNIKVNSDGYVYALSGDQTYTTDWGLWRSTNGGTSWIKLTDIYYGGSISISPSNEQIIYISGQGVKPADGTRPALKKSVNGGTTWTNIQDDSLGAVTSVAIHPTNPNIIFVTETGRAFPGTSSFAIPGVYRSEDAGANWQRVLAPTNTDAGNNNVYKEVMFSKNDPDIVYAIQNISAAYQDIGVAEGIWKSDDGGDTWTQINNNIGYRSLATIETTIDNEIYVGSGGGGAYKLGNTETTITTPMIATSNVSVDYANLAATVTLTFDDGNSNNISAFAFVGTDTLTWSSQLLQMSVNNSSDIALLYYDNLLEDSTYYFKAIIQNEFLQKDTLMAVEFIMQTSGAVSDTLYAMSSYDDVYLQYENYIYNYTYLGVGLGTETDLDRARNSAMRFGGVNDILLDSAYFEIQSYGSNTSTITIRIAAEETASPSIFTEEPTGDDDFRTRMTNITTAKIDTTITASWSDNSIQRFDVTNIIQELFDSYTYTNGYITIFVLNNDSDQVLRSWYSFDESGGIKKPKLILYGSE